MFQLISAQDHEEVPRLPDDRNEVADFEAAILSLDRLKATEILAKSEGDPAAIRLVEGIVVPALERIGERWERAEVALSQVYMAGRICEELVDELLPPGAETRKNQPRMAIAVLEDFHLLGKRMVKAVLRASGYELMDYGHGVSADELARKAIDNQVEVLLVSTLMLRSALKVETLKAQLSKKAEDMKVLVGGAPFRLDPELWKDVGADGVGYVASDALEFISNVEGGRA